MTGAPHFIEPADWTEQRWRNGGGTTQEIMARHGEGGLLWRVSTAMVTSDGAYSVFPGLVRISAVIAGQGTVLTDRGSGERITIPPLGLATLDGDRTYEGKPVDGPIRHLNVFFDPGRIHASVEIRPEHESVRGCRSLPLIIQDRAQGDARDYRTLLETDIPEAVGRITVSFHSR